jgi:transcriptional regulator with XRE-family HTH domain
MKKANDRVVENIKKLLKKRQETAEKLAFGAEVSKSTVSRLMSGKLNPTVRLLEKLAIYFETDIRSFFDP